MDPSPGNITPSWPVAIAHGIRNTTNPMIHHPNADGPADWITASFVMNNTIATKIATMSNVVSTLGRMPPATRSEISEPGPVSVVISVPPQLSSIALIMALLGAWSHPCDLPTWHIAVTPGPGRPPGN